MKNKTELIDAVNNLPEFEYREIGLKIPVPASPAQGNVGADPILAPEVMGAENTVPGYEAVPPHWVAITEVGSNDPITFASNRYKLVQFKESFIPLINRHETEIMAKIAYNEGFSVMDIFPIDDELLIPAPVISSAQTKLAPDAPYRIGLSVYNSVDRTSALMIRFSVTDGSRVISFPKNVSSYYQAHVGNVKEKTDSYIELMNKIKDFWPTVLKDMVETEVTSELFSTITAEYKTDPAIIKALALDIDAGSKYNLWQLILEIYDRMGSKKSKSDIHLRKRRDEFISSTMNFAMMLKIMT